MRALLLFALGGMLACNIMPDEPSDQPPTPGPPAAVSFIVQSASGGPTVPPDFLGLGFEIPVMADPGLSDPVLLRLLSNLGPGSLRFGGSSVEGTVWSPDSAIAETSDFQLTPARVDRVFALARQIGWRVTVAVALARFDSAAAAAEAAYLVGNGGDALLGVEVGNEPNLYAAQGLRSPAWNVDSLAAEYDAYAAAILARAPATPLVAPATWCTGGGAWFTEFLDRRHAPIAFTSHHFYPMGRTAPAGSPEEATVANMLSPELMARSRACVDSAAASAASRTLPLRVDETNSAFGFGQPGVSDVFASALWGLDHLFTLAELGVAGVNVQTGTDLQGGLSCAGVYLPVCDGEKGFIPRPLYYAMLMFHQAAVGRLVPVQVTGANETNVVAHAAVSGDGKVRLTIINKDDVTPVNASITLVPGMSPAQTTVLRLSARSLLSQSVTLGGSAVGKDGSWSPTGLEAVAGGNYNISVPPASAALVVFGQEPLVAARADQPTP
ncbi:MAG: glycosyl hydrolase family 79 C-terminal domain-containing protein [Gemmatimonadales bacterium]